MWPSRVLVFLHDLEGQLRVGDKHLWVTTEEESEDFSILLAYVLQNMMDMTTFLPKEEDVPYKRKWEWSRWVVFTIGVKGNDAINYETNYSSYSTRYNV